MFANVRPAHAVMAVIIKPVGILATPKLKLNTAAHGELGVARMLENKHALAINIVQATTLLVAVVLARGQI